MSTACAIVTSFTIAVTAGIAIADFLKAKFVLANSAEVGVPPSWIPRLAAVKAVGAAGLLLGLLGVRLIGTAAAIGLVLFFIGAVGAHVRARVYYNIAFPAGYLALAVASLVLTAAG
jgi:hypothetical protein